MPDLSKLGKMLGGKKNGGKNSAAKIEKLVEYAKENVYQCPDHLVEKIEAGLIISTNMVDTFSVLWVSTSPMTTSQVLVNFMRESNSVVRQRLQRLVDVGLALKSYKKYTAKELHEYIDSHGGAQPEYVQWEAVRQRTLF